jgi:hypothetical protein
VGGTIEYKGKESSFSNDLTWLDEDEAKVQAAAGGHLEIVRGSIPGLDTGGSVIIRANDVDREVVSLAMVSGALKFVERNDAVAFDFGVADFTKDGSWRTLDTSGIITVGAVLVLLRFYLINNTVGVPIYLNKFEAGDGLFSPGIVNFTGTNLHGEEVLVPVGVSRKLKYQIPAVGTFTNIDMSIRGWFSPVV